MKKPSIILLALVVAGFACGLVHLFNLRFKSGDNYPAYSSLRADPLGSKALFDSLDSLLPVRRHLLPLSKLGEGRDTTLFWLGDDARKLRFLPNEFKSLETFVRTGGRLVMAPLPVLDKPRLNRFQAAAARRGGAPTTSTNGPPQPGDDPDELRKISIKDRWEVSFAFAELPKKDGRAVEPASALRQESAALVQLPDRIDVHSGLYFDQLTSDWKPIYDRGPGTNRQPVIIERSMGKGTIVLSADPFLFSNEALRLDRESALLAWFAGPAREVLFDETHLGVKVEPGVATLARQYHLEGFFLALLVLAGLFIWKNSLTFMPPYESQLEQARDVHIVGKDSSTGFVNLLRRNIRPADLLKVCLEQWNAYSAHHRKPSPARLEAMQKTIDAANALDPNQRNPVATYRKLSEILSKRS